jgi:hypothetical protein
MTDFTISGPHEITTYKGKQGKDIGQEEGREFFRQHTELALARGCYVFATRAGRGFTPWYVGKATKNFKQECFAHDKLTKYRACLVDLAKCTPVFFFATTRNARGATGIKHIEEVEKFLIEAALMANPAIANIKGTKKPNWTIAGVIRARGRLSDAARAFKRAFKMP